MDRQNGHLLSDQRGMRMANKGWICLHRSIQDSWVWQNEPFSRGQAWIDLLLTANHEDHKIVVDNNLMTIKRGQMLTSVRKLSERWKWSVKRTQKFLIILEEDQMLTKKSGKRYTLLTILNYAKFQDVSAFRDTLSTTLPTTQGIHCGNTAYPQTTMNNNYNNDNKYTDGTTFIPDKGSVTSKGSKLTQFHNMETNKYDFDALEKYLLERDRP